MYIYLRLKKEKNKTPSLEQMCVSYINALLNANAHAQQYQNKLRGEKKGPE